MSSRRSTARSRSSYSPPTWTQTTWSDSCANSGPWAELSGHPNIVNILQVGSTASGRPYIVMQFHRQGSLDSRIRRGGPLGWDAVLHLGVKLSGALGTAHRTGILHRDVKPANVLLTEYGEPQLTDFGIARIVGGFETTDGHIIGSPAFTAPEVLRGEAPDPGADVYGLGATLFCALTGHAAFERRSGEQVVAQFLRMTSTADPGPARPAESPTPVCAAIEHAMATARADRPASAAEFGDELRDAQRRSRHCGRSDSVARRRRRAPAARNAAPPSVDAPCAGTLRPRRRPPPATSSVRRAVRAVPGRPYPAARDAPRRGTARRLTVIHAPAGFGKSTLAAQWRQRARPRMRGRSPG